jgi:hypothetical protein
MLTAKNLGRRNRRPEGCLQNNGLRAWAEAEDELKTPFTARRFGRGYKALTVEVLPGGNQMFVARERSHKHSSSSEHAPSRSVKDEDRRQCAGGRLVQRTQ